MKALTREEAMKIKVERTFPDFIIQAFNEELQNMVIRGECQIYQNDVIERILNLRPEYSRQDFFNNNWLDVEDHYRAAGWTVQYHKPAYYEVDAKAFWSFT